jgi:hypothetical protein
MRGHKKECKTIVKVDQGGGWFEYAQLVKGTLTAMIREL